VTARDCHSLTSISTAATFRFVRPQLNRSIRYSTLAGWGRVELFPSCSLLNTGVGMGTGLIQGRFQLTTDGLRWYVPAVEEHFAGRVDYAQLILERETTEESGVVFRLPTGAKKKSGCQI
jgi:hypothetical protein